MNNIKAIFITGPQDQRTSINLHMSVWCESSDSGVTGNGSAHLSLNSLTDSQIWNHIFPRQSDGTRWYAVELAFVASQGTWDSNNGENYQIVLERK